ncbi:MAG: tetratricopeptide repeat protein [Ramlibacter sp.]
MSLKSLRIVLLALMTLALAGLAAAQGEPTIKQIYDTAQSGQLDKARQMTQEVLRNHPNSAKAHFVMAELDAAKGNANEARAELAQAESLAPGLPFASPQAVQALRAKLNSAPAARSPEVVRAPAAATPREAPGNSSFPWGLALLAAAALAVVATVWRSRAAARDAAARNAAATGYGANAYGAPAGGPGWGPQPGYGPPAGYGAPPAQPGMGGQVMGGLATGLAVGAGVVAAQEIGRRMLGEHGQQGAGSGLASQPQGDSPLARDAGLGAIDGASAAPGLPEDFGIADGGSWDGGGDSFDVGGVDDGGSWDT